ncbi:MAG: hypothetical protein ACRDPC_14080 [Solirubrobacteraceae bacterium]
MAAVADPEQQLAWEDRQRKAAGAAGVLAGLASLGADLWSQATFRDVPRPGFLESLGQAAAEGPIGRVESVRTAFFEFYDDKAVGILGSAVVRGIGLIALAWAVTFVAVAVRARRPEFPRPVVFATLIGAALSAISTVLGAGASAMAVGEFLDGPRTVDAAADVAGGSLLLTAQIIGPVGQLALAAGMFLVSLNAQRVGLLTRFLGILGMITAFLMVFPLGPLPVVQAFWLVALGLIILGVAPGGVPPAWKTGKAEPWPSQREMADARRRQAEARRGGRPAEEAEPEPERVAAGRQHPSSKKRKRKRRD